MIARRAMVLFILLACSKPADGGDDKKAEPKAKKTSTVAAGSTGTLTGKITFEGTPPAMPELARFTEGGKPKDPACATKENAEFVVVKDGGLRDVVVRLAVGAAPKPSEPPAPAVIDQKNCRYAPHVLGIVAGQKIAYRNSDATMHNVHTYTGADTDFNVAQPKGSGEAVHEVSQPPGDTPYRVKCDVHPWMSAYVLVTDHPYFAVTSDDGTFKLENVPLGSYKLQAWHPSLGMKTIDVKVEPGKPIEVKFPAFAAADYKAPE